MTQIKKSDILAAYVFAHQVPDTWVMVEDIKVMACKVAHATGRWAITWNYKALIDGTIHTWGEIDITSAAKQTFHAVVSVSCDRCGKTISDLAARGDADNNVVCPVCYALNPIV